MRLIYVTDLHGNHDKYRRVLAIARQHGVDLVVNGGDLLPKGGDLHAIQRGFLDGFLDSLLDEYDAAGIHHVACMGNDDLAALDDHFDAMCIGRSVPGVCS